MVRAAPHIAIGHDQHPRLDLPEAIGDGHLAHIGRADGPDRPHAGRSEQRDNRVRRVRQVRGHAVAGLHAHLAQGIGQRSDALAQLAPVLWSAGDLLTGGRLDRVRRCANPDCGWLFVDDSRAGKRRWCSMSSCGNRAKARRHYHKTKDEDS